MGLSFKSAIPGGVTTNPFSADSDPNVSAPLPGRILELPDRTVNGALARDARMYVEFTTPGGSPALDIVPWVFDEKNANWAALAVETFVPGNGFLVIRAIAPGRLFFQLTNLSGGTVDSVEPFVAPLG